MSKLQQVIAIDMVNYYAFFRGVDMTEISTILLFLAGGIIGFVICYITMGKKQAAAQQQEQDNLVIQMQHLRQVIFLSLEMAD